jgi:murein L,D-transpeptidase YafK
LAASGTLGPKLREGDRQVPVGIYEIESLNPNSAYHVSLRLNYPNAFDRAQAAKDGRTNLGRDIMIHGKSVSVGCLALGDEAAEDVFTLVADAGIQNVKVICSPVDFRKRAGLPRDFQGVPGTFEWTLALYQHIYSEMLALPAHE